MRTKLFILLLTLVVLVSLSGIYVANGLQAYFRYQQNTMAKQQHCGGEAPVRICVHTPTEVFSAFYPTYVANGTPLFTIDYSSSSPLVLFVSVGVAGLTSQQLTTVDATANVQSVSIVPPLNEENFRKLTAEDHTSLHIQVTDTTKHSYYLYDIPVLFHSRWLMQWVTSNRLKIAAWVTPEDPAIGTLVLKAAKHLSLEPPPIPSAMVGYSKANSKEIIAQVDALYDTLRLDYHMHYQQASIPYSGPGNNTVATQNIKLPTEVLQQRSGMCIELTVLLASAVERIGLHAEIVIIPGHAFLGVAVTPDDSQFEYWDAVQVDNNVVGDSANVATDEVYLQHKQQHTILDTILISDARSADIQAML